MRGRERQREGETEKSQSASAGVSLTSANTDFLAESLTDPWSTLRPAALWKERPPNPAPDCSLPENWAGDDEGTLGPAGLSLNH